MGFATFNYSINLITFLKIVIKFSLKLENPIQINYSHFFKKHFTNSLQRISTELAMIK